MDPLLDDLPRGHNRTGQSPASSFETTENLRKTSALAFQPGKIFLGVVNADIHQYPAEDGRLVRYALGGHPVGIADDRHIITVAGSRAGKGRAVIIPNLLTWPGSVMATDPKGELASITARWRAEGLHQTVHVLDPFGTTSEAAQPYRASFNPLTMLDPDGGSIVEDAGLIADALVVAAGNDPHWDESARNFIEGVILHVATHPAYQGQRNLVTVRNLVMGQNKNLQNEMQENTAANLAIIDAATDFYEKADRERESVLSTARRHLRFLTYRPIQDVLRGESINLRDLKTKNMTVYLCLPAMRMGTCFRWFRLFVNLTLAAMEQEKTRPALPVLLCLDEFAVLGHMKTIEDAAGQIAGLGCKLWPIIQDLGQLKTLYQDRWETFMGNAGVLQFFGNSDLTTLDWISNRLGQTMITTESRSETPFTTRAKTGTEGRNWSPHVHNLMTAEEASRYFGRDDKHLRQLVIHPGSKPMILQRVYYDQHELFKDRYDAF
jgi:type IV secretion system protein VirD4